MFWSLEAAVFSRVSPSRKGSKRACRHSKQGTKWRQRVQIKVCSRRKKRRQKRPITTIMSIIKRTTVDLRSHNVRTTNSSLCAIFWLLGKCINGPLSSLSPRLDSLLFFSLEFDVISEQVNVFRYRIFKRAPSCLNSIFSVNSFPLFPPYRLPWGWCGFLWSK